jgi:hypothetical protein
MTPEQFTFALERELQSQRAAFDLGDLLEFAEGVWPLAREQPDVRRWAAVFLERRAEAEAEAQAGTWFDPSARL